MFLHRCLSWTPNCSLHCVHCIDKVECKQVQFREENSHENSTKSYIHSSSHWILCRLRVRDSSIRTEYQRQFYGVSRDSLAECDFARWSLHFLPRVHCTEERVDCYRTKRFCVRARIRSLRAQSGRTQRFDP